VVTVGAITDAGQIASFSSRGPTSDGRVKPDIVFPGEWITAAQSEGTALGDVIQPGYVALRGTSMATPHCAGAVCLLLQAKPDLKPADIKRILLNTAVDLSAPANAQGSGKADLPAALSQAIEGPTPTPTPDPTPDPTPQPPPEERKGCLQALFGG
jgi:serine protease AprX